MMDLSEKHKMYDAYIIRVFMTYNNIDKLSFVYHVILESSLPTLNHLHILDILIIY